MCTLADAGKIVSDAKTAYREGAEADWAEAWERCGSMCGGVEECEK